MTKIFDVKDEEDGFMLTDTAIKYEEMIEVSASAEFGGNCTRKKHKHRSRLAPSGSGNEVLHGHLSKGVRLPRLEAEDTRAIRGDVPTTVARDSLDSRGRPSTVDRLYKGKSSERLRHSDEASVDTCAPRGDVLTTAAQDSSLDPRVCPAKVDRLS